MSDVEVLVACMNKKDDSLYKDMNLQTDAVLSCQGDKYFYKEFEDENHHVIKLVSTTERGVGKNRNKALTYASGKYIMCADEDMIYRDNYEQIVIDTFKKKPKADMIVFNLEYLNLPPEKPSNKKLKIKRVHIYNCLRHGAARIAVKRSSLEKARLYFSPLYGGGATFSSGEDSLFIVDALRKGLKIYYYPLKIASVKQDGSTWFTGYNEKYFIDKGVLFANAFPKAKYFICLAMSFKMRNLNKEYGFLKVYSLMKQGIKNFKKFDY